MKNYSLEHLMYLKKMKKEKIFIIISRFFIILFFLFLWEFLSRVGIINTFLFSSPSVILSVVLLKTEVFLNILTLQFLK